jgi:hypothetical protein
MSNDALTQAAVLPKRSARSADGPIELVQDEADPLSVFMALDTQWRWHAMAGARLGLDYAAIPQVAAMLGIEMTPRLFIDLKAMEAEALAVWAARS